MNRIAALLFTIPIIFWSSDAWATVHRLKSTVTTNSAKSEAYIFSPWPAEVVIIDLVRGHASIYEEGTVVDTDDCADARSNTGSNSARSIKCTAWAIDNSLTQGCAYCNDDWPPTAPDGASWVSAINLLFGLIPVEVWRRDTYVNGRSCAVNNTGGNW